MSMVKNWVRRIYRRLRRFLSTCRFFLKIKLGKNVFVFGAPFHTNMGDQAQTYCIEKYLKSAYPNYRVSIYETTALTWEDFALLRKIHKFANRADKVFLHSGYHTTDLYMLEENMQRRVIQLFCDRQIVLLPQTVYYKTVEEREAAQAIYNAHPNLLMMCRDHVSYQTAQQLFPSVKTVLMPDIVTTLIGTKRYTSERKGIMLCLRNDKEAFYTAEQINALKTELEEIDVVDTTDTTIQIDMEYLRKNREKVLHGIWDDYAHYKVIVTDRYHGTIFSLIAATPVVVISSTDHKLSSGVKWFPQSFSDYVCYEPDLDKIAARVQEICAREYDYRLDNYFHTNYYAFLREIVEGR